MSIIKKGLRFCWNRLKDMYYFIPSMKGYHHLKQLQNKRPGTAIFMTSYALGDLVYAMAYLAPWRKMNHGKKIVLVADPKKKDIIESYSDVDEVVYYGRDTTHGKEILIHLNGSRIYSFIGRNRDIYNTIPEQIYGLKRGKSNLELMKEYLGLSEDSQIVFPHPVKVMVTSIPGFEKRKKKIAVINPYCSSKTICFCPELLKKIVAVLKEKGMIVYSNVIGEQKPLDGTYPLRCDLLEMYSIADEIPLVVSVRSGIMDWIVSTKSKKFVIYASTFNKDFSKMFDLSAWGTNNCKEVHMADMDDEEAIHILEEYIGGGL